MRVFKYFFNFFIILFLFILIINKTFKINTYHYSNEDIEVEIKGEVINGGIYKLKKGSTFNDILKLVNLNENADISNYSLQEPLYNKQIIIIGNKEIKKISINTASKDELCSLSGIGEKTAEAIIEYRIKNNGFKYIDELKNVKGIGEKKFEKIKEQISL